MYNRRRGPYPCDSYAGNVCSGFGGETICHGCGWDMFEHPRNPANNTIKIEYLKKGRAELGIDELIANHPEVTFEVEHSPVYESWSVRDSNGVRMLVRPGDDLEVMYQKHVEYFRSKDV